MKIEVKTGTRKVTRVDRFGVVGDKVVPVAEVWIGGVCTHHYCNSPEEARALVVKFAFELGLS